MTLEFVLGELLRLRPHSPQPAPMIRLLYISASRIASDLQEKQLHEILDASKRNNEDLGITGNLVHGGGMFLQVLEGPDNNVLRTYWKILSDARHTDSTTCRNSFSTPLRLARDTYCSVFSITRGFYAVDSQREVMGKAD